MLDAQHHALAVDIRDFERDHFGNAQAGAIGDAERGLVLDARRRIPQARDLLWAEDDRQLAWFMDNVRRRATSARSSVTVKRNRNAVTVALIAGGRTCV